MIAAAAAAAVALTRGPVVESVTQRSAVVSFRTSAPARSFVALQNGVRIEAGVLATGRFRAAPTRATRFTFAVVGDFGSGNANEAAVASMIESWHPDFVLTVGDNELLGLRNFGQKSLDELTAALAAYGIERPEAAG